MNRAATLRVSLLVALGIVPVACGGTTRNDDNGGSSGNAGAGKGGGNQAGTAGRGGDATSGSGGASGGATATGGAGAGGPVGGDAGSGGRGFVCKNPKVDPESGLVVCDEGGYTHRPEAVACDNAAGQPGMGGAGGEGSVDPRELPRASDVVPCTGPGDCAEFQWGYCGGDGGQIPYCRSGCVTDSDCGAGSICVCGNPSSPTGGECLSAECATDADCPGSLCVTHDGVGCGPETFRCISARDSCASNADCAADGKQCVWNPDIEARECDFAAVCGRPFLVAERPRLPAVEARRDWSDTLQPRVDHLSSEDRAALAEHWTELGRMEHASIAAFARFSLQLLSLGAPPELVEACTRALADETAHAKLCFGIASAYAGRAIGPGPLDVTRSLEPMSLADIVDLVILEGCVGETSAALDAADAADNAADPVIRDAYARIAADEQRHAELAFRFVQWALTQDPSSVRPRLAAALGSKAFDGYVARAVAAPCLRAVLAA